MAVTVDVLGAVIVRVDGAPVELRGRRTRELLARLVAADGQVVSTDRLVDDLWAGEPPPKALASLQVHVSHLRRSLEPHRERRAPAEVLVSAAPGYALRLPADAVDAWRFQRLAARAGAEDAGARRAMLADALACWSGPAYAEFVDAAWAASERTRLDGQRRTTVEALAAIDLARGDTAAVVAALQPQLAGDPTREETARLLALALYRAGQQADALAVLRDVRTHLADELGVDPSPAVRALESDILNHADTLGAPTGAVSPRVRETVGRDAELAVIDNAAAQASGSGVRLVWLAGEAGEGKTALAEAAAQRRADGGWRVAWGRCPEVEGAPPAWAWREIADALGLASVDEQSPFLLGRHLGHQLARVANTAPVLLVVDDAHRADDLGLQVLRQVVETLADAPVLVLVSYRPSEETAGLAAARGATVVATAAQLRLRGLDRDATAHLARTLGLDADDATVDVLADRSGGNPLFVRELARLLAARGSREAAEAVPDGVADVLRARAARLPAPSLTALRQAAVLGREVAVDDLAAAFERDVDELLDQLEPPLLAGLLDDAGAGRVRFGHALIRDTFYADTPPLRRARWHAQALEAFEQRRPDDVDTLAHHAMAGLRPDLHEAALRYTRAAGDRALRAGAASTAADRYREALSVAPDDRTMQVELHASAVRALARAGAVAEARALQRAAVERAGDDDALVRTALTAWEAPLIWSVRTLNQPEPVLLAAARRQVELVTDGADRAALLCALFREVENYDDEATLAASAEALTLARAAGDARLLCAALNVRGYAALGPDLDGERAALAHELIEVAHAAGQDDYEAAGHWLAFLAAAARGDLGAAQPEVDAAVELAGTGQLAGLLVVLGVWRATLLALAGRPDDSLAQMHASLEAQTAAGGINAAVALTVARVVIAFAEGDLSGLVDELWPLRETAAGALVALALLDAGRRDEAQAVFDGSPLPHRSYYWLALVAARAHAAARLGRQPEARELYGQLLPWAGRIAGLDSGTIPLGPVDDALAACAELLGDTDAAAQHRRDGAGVRAALDEHLERLGYR